MRTDKEIEEQANKNYNDFKMIEEKIKIAATNAGITLNQAIKFMDDFGGV